MKLLKNLDSLLLILVLVAECPGFRRNALISSSDVRIATVSSFCYIMTNSTVGVDLVDRVITQLTEVVASSVENDYEEHSLDGTLLGLHSLRCTLINLVTEVGAVLHPKFRDECKLPCSSYFVNHQLFAASFTLHFCYD